LQQVNIVASADPAVSSKKAEIAGKITQLLARLGRPPEKKQEAVLDPYTGYIAARVTAYYY
ncbi:MAG: hypothetical protein LBB63_00410, partial [Holosporaceae bacterium]|nr:hypothetical protein [Holosporaceae bacterium]